VLRRNAIVARRAYQRAGRRSGRGTREAELEAYKIAMRHRELFQQMVETILAEKEELEGQRQIFEN